MSVITDDILLSCFDANRVQKCVQSVIEIYPPVTRPMKGCGMSSVRQQFSLVNIWDATDAYLRSKGYMRSEFQNGIIENLMDFDSFQKKVSFFFLMFQLEHNLI